jgi:hypothetical protein
VCIQAKPLAKNEDAEMKMNHSLVMMFYYFTTTAHLLPEIDIFVTEAP